MGYRPLIAVIGLPLCLFTAIAPTYISHYHLAIPTAAGIYFCFVSMLILVALPGVESARKWLAGRVGPLPLLFAWCMPYLLYAAGTGDFRWQSLLRLACVGGFLLLTYGFFPVAEPAKFAWQDLVVASGLAAALLSHQLSGIWNIPVNLDFLSRLFLVIIGAWTWVFVRPVPELGFSFSFSVRSFKIATISFAAFSLIALPAGFALQFISWNPRHRGLSFFADYIEIFLFIALLEELFFRGFLQTLISNRLGSSRFGHILVSCLFGLFHILHAPFPNWRYVLLATIAGWFYGWAFLKSGNLMAPVLTHAMVDTVWRNFF